MPWGIVAMACSKRCRKAPGAAKRQDRSWRIAASVCANRRWPVRETGRRSIMRCHKLTLSIAIQCAGPNAVSLRIDARRCPRIIRNRNKEKVRFSVAGPDSFLVTIGPQDSEDNLKNCGYRLIAQRSLKDPSGFD